MSCAYASDKDDSAELVEHVDLSVERGRLQRPAADGDNDHVAGGPLVQRAELVLSIRRHALHVQTKWIAHRFASRPQHRLCCQGIANTIALYGDRIGARALVVFFRDRRSHAPRQTPQTWYYSYRHLGVTKIAPVSVSILPGFFVSGGFVTRRWRLCQSSRLRYSAGY